MRRSVPHSEAHDATTKYGRIYVIRCRDYKLHLLLLSYYVKYRDLLVQVQYGSCHSEFVLYKSSRILYLVRSIRMVIGHGCGELTPDRAPSTGRRCGAERARASWCGREYLPVAPEARRRVCDASWRAAVTASRSDRGPS